jgi:hypothetical protein
VSPQPCLFCGGDASEPDHLLRCDGRQGQREAADAWPSFELPPLISGITPETYGTSASAAASVEDDRATQRAAVYDAIRRAGPDGRTDDELQVLLDLDGSSERPRRWELWKLDQIRIRHDAEGKAVRRVTRTNRHAVVWVVAA